MERLVHGLGWGAGRPVGLPDPVAHPRRGAGGVGRTPWLFGSCSYAGSDKGTPVVRRGRKATGPDEPGSPGCRRHHGQQPFNRIAGLPKNRTVGFWVTRRFCWVWPCSSNGQTGGMRMRRRHHVPCSWDRACPVKAATSSRLVARTWLRTLATRLWQAVRRVLLGAAGRG